MKFLKYFENNSNFINLDSIGDVKIKHRTNNQIELFNRLLNEMIETKLPKISYLIEKFKMIIINKYNEYIIADNTINNHEKYNIFKDIYKFTVNFSKRYNKKFDFHFLIQDNENSIKNIKLICNKISEQLFDIFIEENQEGLSENENIENIDNSLENDPKDEEDDFKEKNENINENNSDYNKKNNVFDIDVIYERKRKVPSFTYLEKIDDS